MAEAAAGAAGSMVMVALAVRRRGGMHTVSLQVWYRTSAEMSDAPAAASGFSCNSSRKTAELS
jgi:hypothetical protein